MTESLQSRFRTAVSYLLAVLMLLFVGGMAYLFVQMMLNGV